MPRLLGVFNFLGSTTGDTKHEVFGLFSLHHVYPKICTAVKLYEMREIQLPIINHEARSNILGLLPSSVDRSHLRTTRILASQS